MAGEQSSGSELSPWARDILRRAERAVAAESPRAEQPAPPQHVATESRDVPAPPDDLELARHHFHELVLVIERLLGRLELASIPHEPVPVATPAAAPHVPAGAPAPPAHHMDPALLLATEMAAAGHGREQIAGRLREEFGIADPEPVLASVFGPPAPGDPSRPRG